MFTIRETSALINRSIDHLQKVLKKDANKSPEQRTFPNARIVGTGGSRKWQIPQEDIDMYLAKQKKD